MFPSSVRCFRRWPPRCRSSTSTVCTFMKEFAFVIARVKINYYSRNLPSLGSLVPRSRIKASKCSTAFPDHLLHLLIERYRFMVLDHVSIRWILIRNMGKSGRTRSACQNRTKDWHITRRVITSRRGAIVWSYVSSFTLHLSNKLPNNNRPSCFTSLVVSTTPHLVPPAR